jgi:Deoxyribonuclease II
MPQIYESRGTFDALVPLLNGEYDGDPVCETFQFVTDNIQGFAKTAAWNSDLYENCITPSYNQGLVVESWLHGDSPLGPTCSPYAVVDVVTLNFGATSFSNYDDHSKWAVGNHTNLVCFSDINRMESQFARNGAGFCFEDAGLWMSMLGVVISTDSNC